jgi:hypothetical protein
MRFHVHSRIVAVALLLTIAACTTWEPYEVAPTQDDLPPTIRLTLTTGDQMRLAHPSVRIVEGDTLISGRVYEGGPVWETSLRDVQGVESGSVDGSASFLAGLGVIGGRGAMVRYLIKHHCETRQCE